MKDCVLPPSDIGWATQQGYRYAWIDGKNVALHRLALEQKLGRPIAPGMKALHSCNNPPCINQDHLREGTQRENILQMYAQGRGNPNLGAHEAAKTHCPAGHEYDAENTRTEASGKRHCRACDRERKRKTRGLRESPGLLCQVRANVPGASSW
jgi:hypothetical protein